MRIIFLDTKPIRRGAQVFSHELSAFLKNQGVQTKRIYLYTNDSSVSLTLNDEDEILSGDEKHPFEKILTIHPLLLFRLAVRIKKFKPDIILLNGSKTLKYGALAKKLLFGRFKLVYRVIDSPVFWNTSFLTKFYYNKIIVPIIDAAAGVSHASLRDMKDLYTFSKPSKVIHRAVNFSSFANTASKEICRLKLGISKDKKVLIFIGNLTSQKRPDRLIEVVKRVYAIEKNIHTLILGDGSLRGEMELKVQSAGLQSIFSFLGYQENVGSFIAASDVLLLTSDTEGLPGVIPEAAYFEVPSIASNVGGVAECIKDEISGFILDKDDVEGFVRKSIYLLQNHEIRNAMGHRARELALNDFDITNVANQYADFFKSLK